MTTQEAEKIINDSCAIMEEVPVETAVSLTPNLAMFISVITEDAPKDKKGDSVVNIKEIRGPLDLSSVGIGVSFSEGETE